MKLFVFELLRAEDNTNLLPSIDHNGLLPERQQFFQFLLVRQVRVLFVYQLCGVKILQLHLAYRTNATRLLLGHFKGLKTVEKINNFS